MICPMCICNAALLVAGAVSTGGLTAVSAKVLRRSKNGDSRTPQNSNQRRFDDDKDSNHSSDRVTN